MNSTTPIKTILILVANPKGTSRLRLEEEARELRLALRQSKRRDQYKVEIAPAVRCGDIHQEIMSFQPEIVHFSGHGSGQNGLVFEDETGHEKLVDAQALAELFGHFAKYIKCVLLNACYSDVQAEAIAQYIDYVIGMSQEIGDKAAIDFTLGFYGALGDGESIQSAYELGCKVMRVASIPGYLTPQPKLFTKSHLQNQNSNTTFSVESPMLKNTDCISNNKIEVFLSHSPLDESLRKGLETSLQILERRGLITIWDESKIAAGKNKKIEIETRLKSAHIILPLISENFLSQNEKINEMKRAIRRRDEEGTLVIPILLSYSPHWQNFQVSEFQQLGDIEALPRNGRFVTGRYWKSYKEAFRAIAEELAIQIENRLPK